MLQNATFLYNEKHKPKLDNESINLLEAYFLWIVDDRPSKIGDKKVRGLTDVIMQWDIVATFLSILRRLFVLFSLLFLHKISKKTCKVLGTSLKRLSSFKSYHIISSSYRILSNVYLLKQFQRPFEQF